MESVLAGGASSSSQLILLRRGLFTPPNHRIPIAASKASFDFRLRENVLKLQTRQRWIAVSASKSNPPPDGNSINVKSGGGEEAPQGPPFLTILAGFLVMFLVFWVVGSVLMWLINLFVTLPPPK